ncbi:hypothetical protein BpHYR1_013558 [Brachionus plicatilis]|uniref:Uncharacterized protein n=1 Tax=Brachionus plicatilis TaxID=10195 RepID=A0A3M7T886_BRAPC|nr:hypothetical protein BpHYR1_013558 [Brachionus plicatilis]
MLSNGGFLFRISSKSEKKINWRCIETKVDIFFYFNFFFQVYCYLYLAILISAITFLCSINLAILNTAILKDTLKIFSVFLSLFKVTKIFVKTVYRSSTVFYAFFVKITKK